MILLASLFVLWNLHRGGKIIIKIVMLYISKSVYLWENSDKRVYYDSDRLINRKKIKWMKKEGHQESQWPGGTCPMRKSLSTGACSAYRRDCFRETQQQPSSTYTKAKEKTEPGSSQWWIVGGQETRGINLNKEMLRIQGKKFSL